MEHEAWNFTKNKFHLRYFILSGVGVGGHFLLVGGGGWKYFMGGHFLWVGGGVWMSGGIIWVGECRCV